jgi:hypothetical protein
MTSVTLATPNAGSLISQFGLWHVCMANKLFSFLGERNVLKQIDIAMDYKISESRVLIGWIVLLLVGEQPLDFGQALIFLTSKHWDVYFAGAFIL